MRLQFCMYTSSMIECLDVSQSREKVISSTVDVLVVMIIQPSRYSTKNLWRLWFLSLFKLGQRCRVRDGVWDGFSVRDMVSVRPRRKG